MLLVRKISRRRGSIGLLPQALEQKHLVLKQNIVEVFGDNFSEEDVLDCLHKDFEEEDLVLLSSLMMILVRKKSKAFVAWAKNIWTRLTDT